MRAWLRALADDLRDRGKLDVSECFVDATFASAKKGRWDWQDPQRQGGKITAMADRHGLPIAVCTESAQLAEVNLVQLHFDFMFVEVMPEYLIGDRAYDSDKLDEELLQRGVEGSHPIAATVGNLKIVTRSAAINGVGRSSGPSGGCTTITRW